MNEQCNDRILVFIPAYNCEKQISRVLNQFIGMENTFSEVIVVDNRSNDNTIKTACTAAKKIKIPTTIVKNNDNYGLGGSHKTAFKYAIENKFDYIVVLHGDDQGDINDLVPHIHSGHYRKNDCLLGARFMKNSTLEGYSLFRTTGNYVFNLLFSLVAHKKLSDLGSGLNMYKVKSLAKVKYLGFANDLTFNYYMILASVSWKWRIKFFPITWREDDQISNVKLFKQSQQIISILIAFVMKRNSFLSDNHSGRELGDYSFTIIEKNGHNDE